MPHAKRSGLTWSTFLGWGCVGKYGSLRTLPDNCGHSSVKTSFILAEEEGTKETQYLSSCYLVWTSQYIWNDTSRTSRTPCKYTPESKAGVYAFIGINHIMKAENECHTDYQLFFPLCVCVCIRIIISALTRLLLVLFLSTHHLLPKAIKISIFRKQALGFIDLLFWLDRKSTRLNSSH